MADTQPPKKKRLVKNPETFRERALKAGEEADKPRRTARIRQVGGSLARPVARPVASAAGKAASFKPLRLLGKILLPVYFRQSWHELRQVHWPSRKESRQLTFAVIVFAVAFGIAIAIVDFGLDRLFRDVLLK
jgi:preprotein translocase SecE subunit